MKAIILIFVTLVFSQVYCQSDDPVFKQLQQMREEMMKQMNSNDSFDAEVQKLFQRMQKMGQIQGLPGRFYQGVSNIEYFWKDDKTLVIKVSKDDEINVDVKDGMVLLKGTKVSKTQNSFSKSTFTQSIQLRPTLDPTSVEMKMDQGNIVLSFKLKGPKSKNI